MNSGLVYSQYQAYCRSVGIQPATQEVYERELFSGPTADFSTYGMDRLMLHAGRRLRKAFVLRIGDALGVADEALMLRSLGLIDDHGDVTEKGKRLSKIRVIDGTKSFRLWNVSRVAKLCKFIAPLKPEPEERPVEPEVQELLTSNAVLDTISAPEPDMEAIAA
jgi:hypothetical protein